MTPKEFTVHQQKFFQVCVTITAAKNQDYSPDNIFLAEVIDTAFELHVTVPIALGILLKKHWSAITSHVKGEKPLQSESIDNRLPDAVNYLSFLWVWEHQRHVIVEALRYRALHRNEICTCRAMLRCELCQFMDHLDTLEK